MVWSRWNIRKLQRMYNLTVATAHTFFVGDGQWLVHNACPDSLKLRVNGETPHTIRGKQAHKNYALTQGGDYKFEQTIPGVGRVDAINYDKSIIRELKPDNPRAIQRGMKQVEYYRVALEKITGRKWTTYVDVYAK